MDKKVAVIFGAGPAGLTAAYELIQRTDIIPIIYEATSDIGGIAKTLNYKGNRIDIGGHRFFSDSDRVIKWWLNMLPLQGAAASDDIELKREIPLSKEKDAPDPEKTDRVMLVRRRISRIFYLRKFFDYPLSLSLGTFLKLGIVRIFKILLSYIKSRIFPIKEEKTLEDFFINRFGEELYYTFFKDYAQKICGAPCQEISAEWGVRRIRGLSVGKALAHAVKKIIFVHNYPPEQKKIERSLIGQFMYPKLGPGQLWEEVARIIVEKGGSICLRHKVSGINYQDNQICGITVKSELKNEAFTIKADYYFSTIPIKELIQCLGDNIPGNVQEVAKGLAYRDFIMVGLLLKKLKIGNETNIKTINGIIPDNWLYIQQKDVGLGRVLVFNNWSPYLVADKNTVWLGLEYVCNEGDHLWSKPDDALTIFAIGELIKIGFIDKEDILDSIVIRMPKAYPAYYGTYKDIRIVKDFTNKFENLFLIGRNAMHYYNNMDHSMLTAIAAVNNIINGIKSKDNIWAVNTENENSEEK